MNSPTNARGESTGAQPLVIEHSPVAPSPAAGTLSAMDCASPLALSNPVTVCSGCGKTRTAPGVWSIRLTPNDPVRIPVSHGLCPDCVNTYGQSRPIPAPVQQARILRTMAQGNLDMAKKLIEIGDAGMALAELTQLMVKLDQILVAITE